MKIVANFISTKIIFDKPLYTLRHSINYLTNIKFKKNLEFLNNKQIKFNFITNFTSNNFHIFFHFFSCRFAQEFVDIKERERKRGTRGLSALQRSNFEKDSAAAATSKKELNSNSTVSNANVTEKSVSSESENKETIDPTIIRELQERITKEILNSKLQEKDMQELKVCYIFLPLIVFFSQFYAFEKISIYFQL